MFFSPTRGRAQWALVLATAVAAAALMVTVPAAACLVGLPHGAREVRGDRVVGRLLRASVHADARALQGGKRSAAKVATDEDVDPVFRERAREGAVAHATRPHDLRGDDLAVLDVVQLEALRALGVWWDGGGGASARL